MVSLAELFGTNLELMVIHNMVSGHEGSFIKDMGFAIDDGQILPGLSTFYKDSDGAITRTANGEFGPGDF